MRRKRLATIGAILVAIIALAAFIASPWLTAARLVEALKTGDERALERLVDFRSVRKSLSSQVSDLVVAEAQRKAEDSSSPYAGLVALVAPAVVDQAVRTVVTPKGLARLSRLAREAKQGDAPAGNADRTDGGEASGEPKLGYTGLNSFAAVYEVDGQPRMVWTMGREKLFFWRLKSVEISPAIIDDLELGDVSARK